jgi:hypothetical protein
VVDSRADGWACEPVVAYLEVAEMSLDLWSAQHFQQKTWERVKNAKPDDFEPWEEARARYQAERIEPILDTYRMSDHNWFKEFNRRKGEVTHASDLIFKLQAINPHLQVQNQINFPDWGLYTENLGRIQYLSGFGKGWLTEFSWTTVDERNLPVDHKKGWRTILVELTSKGALTWDQVMSEFGDPLDGFNEERWFIATEHLRLGHDTIAQKNISNTFEI